MRAVQGSMKLFLSSFYYNNSGKTSRADYMRYMVLGYLALFRLDELGFARFRAFVMSDDPLKMMVLLEFLFSKETLETLLKDELCKIFDREFVETKIIGRILHYMDSAQDLMEALAVKAYGMAAKKKAKEEAKKAAFKGKPPTKPVPFKLTRPKPRHVPEPEEIQQGTPAVPVPHKLFARTSLKKIAEEDAERRARSRGDDRKVRGHQARAQSARDSDTVRDLRAKVEEDRMAPCRVRFRAKPAPRQTADAQVKMTAAAIMREDALYKKKQEKEKVTLEKFETELRDTFEFYRWQSEEWKKEEEAKLVRVERLRLTWWRAAGARPRRRGATWRATSLRQQRCGRVARRCCGCARRAQHEVAQKQRLAEAVREVRDSRPAGRSGVRERNVRKRVAVRADIAERVARKKEEDKIEQERRADLIRQIRAIERVPRLARGTLTPHRALALVCWRRCPLWRCASG